MRCLSLACTGILCASAGVAQSSSPCAEHIRGLPLRGAGPIVRAGESCWRVERAHRLAVLVDNAAYFRALRAAFERAQQSIRILGWHFDPRTVLEPDANGYGESVGALLRRLSLTSPQLHIEVLIWDMALVISATRGFYPQRAREWFEDRVHFRLDRRHPRGACHHQKLVVVDDRLAFCSGSDLAPNRWDDPRHLDEEARRQLPSGKPYPPRHAATALFDGPAAVAIGELVRERWRRATGNTLGPGRGGADIWPAHVVPDMTDVPVAIARTAPCEAGREAVRENESLYLDSIRCARDLIYLENQYFASPLGAALAARLEERHGPEILVVCPRRAPNLIDRLTMDPPRDVLIERLRAADRHGRFHVFNPVTQQGRPIIVHSKISVIDDRLLRVGSANLNNRSMGFDTECDVAVDALRMPTARVGDACAAIRHFWHGLIAHHLECEPQEAARAIAREGSYAAAIRSLRSRGRKRLETFAPRPPNSIRAFVAELHLGDPSGTSDSFRPWRRRAAT